MPIVHEINGVGVLNKTTANTLDSHYYLGQGCRGNQERIAVMENYTAGKVRRLTPTECERLQGLPDGYSDIPLNGKPASDSARYKALGNGMAQPCADFIMRRIAEVSNGIGGKQHGETEQKDW